MYQHKLPSHSLNSNIFIYKIIILNTLENNILNIYRIFMIVELVIFIKL